MSTATPAVSQLVVVADTVPWGTLTIDGRAAPNGFAYLRPGHHAVEYLAPPFAPMRCEVSLPHVATDTCGVLPAITSGETGAALVLDMRATPDRLPAAQLQALAAVIQSQLDGSASTTTLTAGDHYAAPDGSVAVARERLAASLTFTLNRDPRRPDAFNTPPGGCATLCMPPRSPVQVQTPPTWQVLAHVIVSWRYTPQAGAGASFAGGVSPANAQDVAVGLDVTWQGDIWQVQLSQSAPPIVCELAGFQLDTIALPFGGVTSSGQAVIVPADGCVLTLDGNGGPVSQLRLFYHCGVLLAADAATQGYMSALPAASPAEQALAARIAGAAF